MMMDEKTFALVLGRMIVLHRQNLGWSQATLSDELNTTQRMVSRMPHLHSPSVHDFKQFQQLAHQTSHVGFGVWMGSTVDE